MQVSYPLFRIRMNHKIIRLNIKIFLISRDCSGQLQSRAVRETQQSRARALPRLPWQRLEDLFTVKTEI